MGVTRCLKCMEEIEAGSGFCRYCGFEQATAVQPANALKLGTMLQNRYFIGKVIGQGGFGITYVGWDTTLEMKVAVKEYFPSGTASRTSSFSNQIQWDHGGDESGTQNVGLDRFLKEARRMARLDAMPSVVRVRDAFQENETAYIVMDFVEGVTLKQYLLNHGVLRCEECIKLLSPILDSLAAIHDHGFIHRDISPDNIMLQPNGTVRLLDMGAVVDVRANAGHASMALVKRNFSAPEQYMDSEVLGSWTDVYAMSATLYYCMTGKVVPEALEREFKKTPLFFDPVFHIPPYVIAALEGGLELLPARRIRDMRELKKRLLPPVMDEIPRTGQPDQQNAFYKAATAQTAASMEPQSGQKEKKKKLILGGIGAALVIVLFLIFPKGGDAPDTVMEPKTTEAETTVEETTESGHTFDGYDKTVSVPGVQPPADNEYVLAEAGIDFNYEINDDGDGIVITEYILSDKPYIRLPDQVDGLPVVKLGSNLFNSNETLEAIILPCDLKIIGSYAFSNYSKLKWVGLPEGLEVVGTNAFMHCNLQELTIPSSVTQIDYNGGLNWVEKLMVEDGNTNFKCIDGCLYTTDGELRAFPAYRTGSYQLFDDTTSIFMWAFDESQLSEVVVPAGVTEIHSYSDLMEIPQVTIEAENPNYQVIDGLLYLHSGVLTRVPENREGSLTLWEGTTGIAYNAFEDTIIEEVVIPGSATVIDDNAFYSSDVQRIELQEGVEILGEDSFSFCYNLTDIVIPRSVKKIGSEAFYSCDALEFVTISRDCVVAEDAFPETVQINYYD